MIRHITLMEVLKLHGQIIDRSGGAQGVRDLGLLESIDEQEQMLLALASGGVRREVFVEWLESHVKTI